jgi:hypothetical protein
MYENPDAYPELLYAITADRVRAMRDEQAVRQARSARRRRWIRAVRRSLSAARTRRGGGTS